MADVYVAPYLNLNRIDLTDCLCIAILELGAWVGTLYSGVLAERISRKYTILVNVVIFCIGVIVQTTAAVGGSSNILGGRFVTGMGVGRYESVLKGSVRPVLIIVFIQSLDVCPNVQC